MIWAFCGWLLYKYFEYFQPGPQHVRRFRINTEVAFNPFAVVAFYERSVKTQGFTVQICQNVCFSLNFWSPEVRGLIDKLSNFNAQFKNLYRQIFQVVLIMYLAHEMTDCACEWCKPAKVAQSQCLSLSSCKWVPNAIQGFLSDVFHMLDLDFPPL